MYALRRLGASIALCCTVLAASAPAAQAAAPPPFDCQDPAVLRMVGAGLHFEGAVPEGFQPTETGLRNPETGEEVRIGVEPADGAATVRIGESRIELRNVRTTGETADGWECAADFTHVRGDRTLDGEASYVTEVEGLTFRVRGRFTVEGVEISF